jgi:L-ascorbate metabolism protein UlaG (beta-lactamase superfamily)
MSKLFPSRLRESIALALCLIFADFSAGSIFFVGTATVILRYAGFTILTDPNFLHAGDTLVHDDLKEIPRRYPDIDLALFHLGGTCIMGLLLTMDAEQGVEAIRIVNPREVIPIHYNDN